MAYIGQSVIGVEHPATSALNATTGTFSGVVTAGAGSIGMGPAFAARPSSGQSAPSADTFTKVAFGTETFDTDANYSAAGAIIAIYKNGSNHLAFANSVGGFEARHGLTVSGLVYLDSDDYVELYIYGPNQALDGGTETFFNGGMVRKA